jgi:hypothetical protein
LEQRISPALQGQLDEGTSERLAVEPVDDRTDVPAEGADAVTGAQKGKVVRHHVVQQRRQVGLDPALGCRLRLLGVAGLKGAAAQDDA